MSKLACALGLVSTPPMTSVMSKTTTSGGENLRAFLTCALSGGLLRATARFPNSVEVVQRPKTANNRAFTQAPAGAGARLSTQSVCETRAFDCKARSPLHVRLGCRAYEVTDRATASTSLDEIRMSQAQISRRLRQERPKKAEWSRHGPKVEMERCQRKSSWSIRTVFGF